MDRTDEAMGFKAEYPKAPKPTKEEAQKLLQLYKLPASMIPVLGAAITTWDIMSDVKQAYDKGGKEAVVELLKEEAPFYAAEAVLAALGPIAAAAKGTKTAARALKAAKPVKKVPRNVKVPRGAPGGGPLRPQDREIGRQLRTDPDFRERMRQAAAIKRKQKAARGAEKRLDQTVSSATKRSARKERLDYLQKQRRFYDSEAEFNKDFKEEIDELKQLISRSEPEKKARRRARQAEKKPQSGVDKLINIARKDLSNAERAEQIRDAGRRFQRVRRELDEVEAKMRKTPAGPTREVLRKERIKIADTLDDLVELIKDLKTK
jgi:hypothetical protein